MLIMDITNKDENDFVRLFQCLDTFTNVTCLTENVLKLPTIYTPIECLLCVFR